MSEPIQSEKIELFDYVRSKYPDVTNTYMNYLIRGISIAIGDSISSTVLKLHSKKDLFVLYYENRWSTEQPYIVRLFKHIKEWYLLNQLSNKKKES